VSMTAARPRPCHVKESGPHRGEERRERAALGLEPGMPAGFALRRDALPAQLRLVPGAPASNLRGVRDVEHALAALARRRLDGPQHRRLRRLSCFLPSRDRHDRLRPPVPPGVPERDAALGDSLGTVARAVLTRDG